MVQWQRLAVQFELGKKKPAFQTCAVEMVVLLRNDCHWALGPRCRSRTANLDLDDQVRAVAGGDN